MSVIIEPIEPGTESVKHSFGFGDRNRRPQPH